MYANAGNSVDVSHKVGAEFLESSKAVKVAWQGPRNQFPEKWSIGWLWSRLRKPGIYTQKKINNIGKI